MKEYLDIKLNSKGSALYKILSERNHIFWRLLGNME